MRAPAGQPRRAAKTRREGLRGCQPAGEPMGFLRGHAGLQAAPAAPAAPKRNLRQVMKHSQMTSHKKGEKGLHFCDTI